MIFNSNGSVIAGSGSGVGLNFRVIGGIAEPKNPKENTILVITEQDITSWLFSANEPSEPTEGMLWLKTGLTSTIAFNALKKNGIQIYVTAYYQWSGSEWVKRSAKIYQNKAWVDTFTYIYNYGETFDLLTGGFKEIKTGGGTWSASSNVENSIYLEVTCPSNHAAYIGRPTVNKIDLTNVNKIYAVGKCTSSEYDDHSYGLMVVDSQTLDTTKAAKIWTDQSASDFEKSLDVSSLSGSYYVIPYARSSYYSIPTIVEFYQIWYE